MAIHVIQSQRIEVLVNEMLKTIRQPTSNPLQVLQTQHFIVPSVAVEKWLTEKIAEQKGISANTEFHHRIRAFQWAAYQAVLDDKDRVRQANIPRIVMQWRVFYDLQPWIQHE
ncbi:exodeoxyribonuclease V subunit gamma, partial [Acinetobacter sp. 207]